MTTVQQITIQTSIVPESCITCGVVFGLGAEFKAQRKDSHKVWYCPNGHSMIYTGQSEAERLKQQLEWARSAAQLWRDQAETAENRRRAEKAAKTRIKNRIANGVCPCCSRSFVDLARHIAGQHPTFAEPSERDAIDGPVTA